MPESLITLKDVENAYLLHKGEVYRDRSNLHKRIKIAEFEASGNIQKTFEDIAYAINNYDEDGIFLSWNFLHNDDGKHIAILPHTFEKDTDEDFNKLSNRHSNFNLSKVVVLYDEPIELEIINALWLMNVGIYLEYNEQDGHYKVIDKDLYGSILNINDKGDFEDKRLFKHYPNKYNDWINNGIKTAKRSIKKDEDITLVSLDIKNFYHSTLIDYDSLPTGKNSKLGRILNQILGFAARDHMSQLGIERNDYCFLPVGPYSSPVIANWIVRDLDNSLRDNVHCRCIYYGRYVDDIFLVYRNDTNDIKNVSSMEDLLDSYHNNATFYNYADQDGRHIKIHLPFSHSDLEFNRDKFKMAVIEKGDSIAIQSFEDILLENSSLPTDFYIEDDEDEDEEISEKENEAIHSEEDVKEEKSSFNVNNAFYQTVTEKFNELLKKDNPRYELSVQLDKIIEEQLTGPYEIDEDFSKTLLGFFRGNFTISFYNLWERVFTFLFATEDIKQINKFANDINKAISLIDNINEGPLQLSKEDLKENIRTTLLTHLNLSLSMAVSLNPQIVKKLEGEFIDRARTLSQANMLRKSFMVRKEYMLLPFTYYNVDKLPENKNLLSKDLWNKIIEYGDSLLINSNNNKVIPIFPSLFDISMSEFVYLLNVNSSKDGDIFHTYKRADTKSTYTYLDDIIDKYNNTHVIYPFKVNEEQRTSKRNRSIIAQIDKIIFLNNKKIDPNVKIGLANIKLDKVRIADCINDKGICKTTSDMYKRHRKLLDLANNEKVKVMVLPEVFVPLQFVYIYAKESLHNKRAFIFGLEHFHISNKCLNMSCIMLPICINNKVEVLPLFRIKNYYSPSETDSMKKVNNTIPKVKRTYYHWIDWYSLQFTLFNCYELTNVKDRSLFKQYVDVIFSIEYNMDVAYYSNIAEATARDNDCFFIQANSSDYGDTRIVAPQKQIHKDKVRIKGGENDVVLTYTLDVTGLRNHLLGNTSPNVDIYKKTAAGFDKDVVNKRINLRKKNKK